MNTDIALTKYAWQVLQGLDKATSRLHISPRDVAPLLELEKLGFVRAWTDGSGFLVAEITEAGRQYIGLAALAKAQGTRP